MAIYDYTFDFVTQDGHIATERVDSREEIPENLPFRSSTDTPPTECLLCPNKECENCHISLLGHSDARDLSNDEVSFITNFTFGSERDLMSWIGHSYFLGVNPLPILRKKFPHYSWKYVKGGWVEMQEHPIKNVIMISTTAIAVEWGTQILNKEFEDQKEYPPVDTVD